MVFPTCASVSTSSGIGKDCSLNIAYNKQIPLCQATSLSGASCRDPQALCSADPAFDFSFDSATDVSADVLSSFRAPADLSSSSSPFRLSLSRLHCLIRQRARRCRQTCSCSIPLTRPHCRSPFGWATTTSTDTPTSWSSRQTDGRVRPSSFSALRASKGWTVACSRRSSREPMCSEAWRTFGLRAGSTSTKTSVWPDFS